MKAVAESLHFLLSIVSPVLVCVKCFIDICQMNEINEWVFDRQFSAICGFSSFHVEKQSSFFGATNFFTLDKTINIFAWNLKSKT